MKKFIVLLLLSLLPGALCGRHKPALRFSSGGDFKILQITDLHLNPAAESKHLAWDNLRACISAEKPDLLMITGDMIYAHPGMAVFRDMLDSLDSYGVPYALVLGNHDRQFASTGGELIAAAMERPLCVVSDIPRLTGDGTYLIEILGSSTKEVKSVIWCFDSGEMSPMSGNLVQPYDYDYVHSDQIEWYGTSSARYSRRNGGAPLPSIAFLHIPLPEYAAAAADGLSQLIGTKGEAVCCSRFNSGLFCKMLEMKDIMGVFCGHDHDNDYAVQYYGVLLAYGRYSGADTEYNNLGLKGCRVIKLHEGKRSFDTWLRLGDGSAINFINYPASCKD